MTENEFYYQKLVKINQMNPNKIVFDHMIANGAKVGSKVRVVQKVEHIHWSDEMDAFIGETLPILDIKPDLGIFRLIKAEILNGWWFPAASLELLPDEMPFEGEIPDGWELWHGLKKVIRIIHVDKKLKCAWVFFENSKQGLVYNFSELTLKPKV